jgi:hypothetical protein
MTFEIGQSAVIVPVPAVEPAVSSWRALFDTSAGFGVPAHVTVIFPFVPVDRLADHDLDDLAAIFRAEPEFTVTFARLDAFAGMDGAADPLYLVPEPDAAFRRLTSALPIRWPETPPYAGTISDPIPHVTVTEFARAADSRAARNSIQPRLPISSKIDRGCLIAFDGTGWREMLNLPFGSADK